MMIRVPVAAELLDCRFITVHLGNNHYGLVEVGSAEVGDESDGWPVTVSVLCDDGYTHRFMMPHHFMYQHESESLAASLNSPSVPTC